MVLTDVPSGAKLCSCGCMLPFQPGHKMSQLERADVMFLLHTYEGLWGQPGHQYSRLWRYSNNINLTVCSPVPFDAMSSTGGTSKPAKENRGWVQNQLPAPSARWPPLLQEVQVCRSRRGSGEQIRSVWTLFVLVTLHMGHTHTHTHTELQPTFRCN